MTGKQTQNSTFKKRTTIFNQLIINVIAPVIVALLVLAIINYQHNKNLLIESNNLKNKLITDEIKNIMEFQDFSFDFLEADLNKRMEFLSGKIVKKFFVGTQDIESADLAEIQKELGMDPQKEDIYIINTKGIVVNTTFKKDLGLNFFSFGEEHKRYLQSIITGENFVSERFSIEKNTQQLKKYSYQPTFDKRYIVELGVYSQQATDIIEMFKHRLNEFSDKQKNIISVDFFIGAETPISFNKNTEVIKESHKDVFLKTFKEQKSNTIVENVDGKKLHYEYAFMQRRNTALYKGAVIRIVSDRSTEDEVLRRELLTFFILFGITITSLLILIFQKTKLITNPIKKLVENINQIKEGDLKIRAQVEGNNEIATLSEQYNLMLEQIEGYYNELEQKVAERTAEISEKKKEIEDSIHYAKRIQNAILPSDGFVKRLLPESFILYKPKDIVSGDFYWAAKKDEKAIFAVVDCTGHGVPGAFMSIVGNNNLNNAVNLTGVNKPSEILNALNEGVTSLLKQKGDKPMSVKDGMDIALCMIDFDKNELEFAGAYNPLVYVRNKELFMIEGDKFPIGEFKGEQLNKFANHKIELKKGDMIYLFSDGYKDQFGGPDDKKFLIKRFKALLLEISDKPLEVQKQTLDKTILSWMGDTPQIDDILVVGVRIGG